MEEATEQQAVAFQALGDPTRLRILQFLAECCCAAVDEEGGVHPSGGPSAGEICCYVSGRPRINSTISAHLKELRQAGLVQVERQGRRMLYTLRRDSLCVLGEQLLRLAGHNRERVNDDG
jgi:ArsR family transcriptional regulator